MGNIGARVAIFAVIIVGFIGYRFFFVDDTEVMGFNDALVDVVGSSDSHFKPVTRHYDQYFEGKEIDIPAMTRAQEALEKNISADLEKLKSMAVPNDDLCKEFHGVCLSYVENSWQIAQKYKEVIDFISKNNPGTEANFEEAFGILNELIVKDGQLFNKSINCQKRMADKFDFEIQ